MRMTGCAGRRAGVIAMVLALAAPVAGVGQTGPAVSAEQVARIRAIAEAQFDTHDLMSLLVQVRVGGAEVMTLAMGEAMTGVPVTADGRFRNGAVALAYLGALSLRLAEDGQIDLDEPIARWLPDLPGADTATPRMLLNMTAGYPDHVANESGFVEPFLADPFRRWSPEDLIAVSLSTPRLFAPGTNWDYSHSDYVILGLVLEAATGTPVARLMQDYILDPLELTGTVSLDTPDIPAPAVHAFTAERGVWEDATFWNPSWTLAEGAVQVTTIGDMARSFDTIVGVDGFLTPEARQQMIAPRLIGFGEPLDGCRACHTLTPGFSYGLGTMLQEDWVVQTPSFGGYASAVATLPEEHAPNGRVTIAVAVTQRQGTQDDWTGALRNWADDTMRLIGAELVPGNPPPRRN